MTVGELIDLLRGYPLEEEVTGQYEGTYEDIAVYRAHNGTVIVELDRYHMYRAWIENGKYTQPYRGAVVTAVIE